MSTEQHTVDQDTNTALGSLMLDLQGLQLSPAESSLLEEKHVGGVILFAHNFASFLQLRNLVVSIREVRPDILIAVDQEGGRVQRFKQDFTRLPPMQAFKSLWLTTADKPAVLELVKDTGWLMAAEVISAGLDLSFAPVLDVDESHCSAIADRAFSADPHEVVILAQQFIAGMHEAGMAATGKHFPGHGAVQVDSHKVLPIDERELADVEACDMLPFVSLLPHLDALMPAHIVFPQVDARPVGFSEFWLQKILREQLQFNGVIFSDDLTMSATESYGDYPQRAQLALNAGCDMVLACNNPLGVNPLGAKQILEFLVEQNWSLSPRLARLRARRAWQREELQSLSRWQTTHNQLRKLVRE